VYCDVVVTERAWTNFVHRTDLEDQFETMVLRDLNELVPHVISAATPAWPSISKRPVGTQMRGRRSSA
jgi:hypothetical protein